jgi:DNA-binding transcriptional MerR regulator
MHIDEFIQNHQPKKRVHSSKLDPFVGDIKRLRDSGYTLSQIAEYLELNDVKATPSDISWFIRTRRVALPLA